MHHLSYWFIEEPLVRKHFVAAFGRYASSWEVDVHLVEVQMTLPDYHPEQVNFGMDVNIRARTVFVSSEGALEILKAI